MFLLSQINCVNLYVDLSTLNLHVINISYSFIHSLCGLYLSPQWKILLIDRLIKFALERTFHLTNNFYPIIEQ